MAERTAAALAKHRAIAGGVQSIGRGCDQPLNAAKCQLLLHLHDAAFQHIAHRGKRHKHRHSGAIVLHSAADAAALGSDAGDGQRDNLVFGQRHVRVPPVSSKMKKPLAKYPSGFGVGAYLFSRAASSQVSSAQVSLTAVFGMGTGVPSPPSAPTLQGF